MKYAVEVMVDVYTQRVCVEVEADDYASAVSAAYEQTREAVSKIVLQTIEYSGYELDAEAFDETDPNYPRVVADAREGA